jgi:predicted RNase H-like HicB family nuclease
VGLTKRLPGHLPPFRGLPRFSGMSEIIFEVQHDEMEGAYIATALGHGIVTQGESLEELRQMVKDAVRCHFAEGNSAPMPRMIRLHFVRDEVLVA